jgi:hypothetical protein
MSWNLLIYRQGEDEEMTPLGSLASVTTALNRTFPGLEWPTPVECELNGEDGFSIAWTVEDGEVRDGYTNGGYNHLQELAALCKQEGWSLADAQEGEDIDLDDPLASFGGEERE